VVHTGRFPDIKGVMDIPDTWSETLLRPLVALVCAGVLGLDRELRGKPAGLRTHMMVALGSAAFTITALQLFDHMRQQGDRWTGVDPIRVVSGIVGGIGFLGAGAIIQSRGSVAGVTTAATIWVVGAIGVSCGAGYYRIAAVVAGYALIILVVVGWLEARLIARPHGDEASDSSAGEQSDTSPAYRPLP
jgi:putative Mg2+ transporter-C (MgtC) family protein